MFHKYPSSCHAFPHCIIAFPWLGLVRKLLRCGNLTSIDYLRSQELDFIACFNRIMAKLLNWTYLHKPLHV